MGIGLVHFPVRNRLGVLDSHNKFSPYKLPPAKVLSPFLYFKILAFLKYIFQSLPLLFSSITPFGYFSVEEGVKEEHHFFDYLGI